MGSSSMNSQKLFQNDFSKRFGIPFRTIHEFPNFPTFGGALGSRVSNTASIGLWGEYASTGGRLHYSDYSGHALLDQVLTSFQVGPYFQVRLNKSDAWSFYFTAHGSVSTTTVNIKSEIKIGSESEIERISLKATNYGLRPGLMLARSVGVLNFQLGAGTEILSARALKSDKDMVIKSSNTEELTAQWNGWRMTFGVGFVF